MLLEAVRAGVRRAATARTVGASRSLRRWSPCCWRRRSRPSCRTCSIARSIAIATTIAGRCVGFARDLNSDLDLNRLSERLVSRVVETLLVDRMALMLEDEDGAALRFDPRLWIRRRASAGAAEALGHRQPPRRRPRRRARRSDRGRPVCRRGDRVLARRRALLLRPLRRQGGHDRGAGAGAQGHGRAAQQRGHGAAGRGRRTDRDGARERPALSSAAHQGARARSDAGLQREHPRVARRRPARARSERPHRALEPRAGAAVRRLAGPRPTVARSRRCSTRRSSRRSARPDVIRRRVRRCRGCRSTRAA